MKSRSTAAIGSETVTIGWGERRTLASLQRTKRLVLRIEVRPTGEVFVRAPFGEDFLEIEERVNRNGAWIFRQIDRISARPSATPERYFLSGETHLLLGKQYRLSIERGDEPQVRLEGTRLVITVRRVDDRAQCCRVLTTFYHRIARDVFSERIDALVPPFIRKGLRKPTLIVRKMSKRWGSFTPNGRIVLNTDLVRASPALIDYVICHELAHAFHPDHGKEWRRLLDTVLPDWASRKDRLESALR